MVLTQADTPTHPGIAFRQSSQSEKARLFTLN